MSIPTLSSAILRPSFINTILALLKLIKSKVFTNDNNSHEQQRKVWFSPRTFPDKLNGSTFPLLTNLTYLNVSKIQSLCFPSTDEKSRVHLQNSKRWMWFSWSVYWPLFWVSQGPIPSKWLPLQECERLLLHGEMSHPGWPVLWIVRSWWDYIGGWLLVLIAIISLWLPYAGGKMGNDAIWEFVSRYYLASLLILHFILIIITSSNNSLSQYVDYGMFITFYSHTKIASWGNRTVFNYLFIPFCFTTT